MRTTVTLNPSCVLDQLLFPSLFLWEAISSSCPFIPLHKESEVHVLAPHAAFRLFLLL